MALRQQGLRALDGFKLANGYKVGHGGQINVPGQGYVHPVADPQTGRLSMPASSARIASGESTAMQAGNPSAGKSGSMGMRGSGGAVSMGGSAHAGGTMSSGGGGAHR